MKEFRKSDRFIQICTYGEQESAICSKCKKWKELKLIEIDNDYVLLNRTGNEFLCLHERIVKHSFNMAHFRRMIKNGFIIPV